MFVTGDVQIDQQIERAVNTHGLSIGDAKLFVLAGMPDSEIAKAAAYSFPYVYFKAWQLAALQSITPERIAEICAKLSQS